MKFINMKFICLICLSLTIAISLLLMSVSWSIPSRKKSVGENWINLDYVKCMKNGLPCSCEKISKPFIMLRLNNNNENDSPQFQVYRAEDLEYMDLKIEKRPDGSYKVLSLAGEPATGYLSINRNRDTLFYIDNNKKRSAFIRLADLNTEEQGRLLSINVTLLNDAFLSRGYLSLNEILKQEKLYCDCNKWLGGINLVTEQNASWVLEQKKDSLVIYRYINDKEPKDLPALKDVKTGKVTRRNIIKKKLFRSYKW